MKYIVLSLMSVLAFNVTNVHAQQASKQHVLQISVINFLTGGLESCNLSDKIFSFSEDDNSRKIELCKNSRVVVNAISNAGKVTFEAIDKESGQKLDDYSNHEVNVFELGKTNGRLSYTVKNPDGFTAAFAEEMTGVDLGTLALWNQYNSESSGYLAKLLQGQKLNEDETKRYPIVAHQMDSLSVEIQKQRTVK
jgi:hypothetical protein